MDSSHINLQWLEAYSSKTLQLTTLLLFICLLYVVIYCIYLYAFHPLAGYPGPFLAKFTNLYSGYYAWTGDIHLDQFRCHQRYGPVVRYAPNRLMINSLSALNAIYGHSSPTIKATTYDALVHRAPSSLTLKDKSEHRQRRKILSQGFSDASLRQFEGKMVNLILKMCQQIAPSREDREWSEPRNMSDWCDYLSFDLMSSIIFGASYSALANETYRHLIEDIRESNVRISVLMQALELSSFRLDRKLFPRSIAARNSFLQFIKILLQDLAKKNRDQNDIFSFLSDWRDPDTNEGLTPDQITSESVLLVIAGTDTSSTVMASTLFYLANNKEAYSKAREEVRERFSGTTIHSGEKLNSCRYLRACIDESMRLSPPTGSVLWREVQSDGLNIDGYYVPPGCNVGTALYALHHDAKIFPQPFDYLPERWLENPTIDAQNAFSPFLIGPRSCVGKSLALREVSLVIATLLATFDFETTEPLKKEFVLKDHITPHKNGPYLRFAYKKPRGQL